MDLTGEDRITLDRGTFKALASETRVEILKRLDGTQRTVSELAREMAMNKATMFQHLGQLIDVGLVKKADLAERATTIKPMPNQQPIIGPPRKWVTYRLTWKGKNVLHPDRVRIALLLSTFAIVGFGILLVLGLGTVVPTDQAGGVRDFSSDHTAPMAVSADVAPTDAKSSGAAYTVVIADVTAGKEVPSGKLPKGVSGLDKGSVRVSYSFLSQAASPEVVKGPVDATANATVEPVADQPELTIAGVIREDFQKYGGHYLRIEVTATDKNSNLVSTDVYEYIEPTGGPDVRFQATRPVFFTSDVEPSTVHVLLENQGIDSAGSFSVGFYLADPDSDRDGILSPDVHRIDVVIVDSLGANEKLDLAVDWAEMTGKIASGGWPYRVDSPPSQLFVVLDDGRAVPEEDESNNVAASSIPRNLQNGLSPMVEDTHSRPPATGAPSAKSASMAPGFEGPALALALIAAVVILRRKRASSP